MIVLKTHEDIFAAIRYFYALRGLGLHKEPEVTLVLWTEMHDLIIKDFDIWCGGKYEDT